MPLAFSTPPIPLSSAHLFAAFFTFTYVGSLYLSKAARLSFKNTEAEGVLYGEERLKQKEERWRNDPEVIRARLFAASVSTALNVVAVYWLLHSVIPKKELHKYPGLALTSTLARLGLTLDFGQQTALWLIFPCLVAPVLYLGPLYVEYFSETLPGQRRWSFQNNVLPLVNTWTGLRNYVVGPITEEIVFRACMLAVYQLAGASRTAMIFLTPLTFGAAHLHHAWDVYNRFGRNDYAARTAFLNTVAQFTYTTLFGFHCAYLFLRSGSILPPIVSHIFCNIMGFPQYVEHLKMFPNRRGTIQLAYFLGIVGYIYTMIRWTRADDSLYWPVTGEAPRY
ncbi:CAAX protease self-immunity-domain-containing protein [Trametes polyzona]|nr:CAAX protease self-immunity-domain-containing protein [Trametes polyzona]